MASQVSSILSLHPSHERGSCAFLYLAIDNATRELCSALSSCQADRASHAARAFASMLTKFPALNFRARNRLFCSIRDFPFLNRYSQDSADLFRVLAAAIAMVSCTISHSDHLLNCFNSVSAVSLLLKAFSRNEPSFILDFGCPKQNVANFLQSAVRRLRCLTDGTNSQSSTNPKIKSDVQKILSKRHVLRYYSVNPSPVSRFGLDGISTAEHQCQSSASRLGNKRRSCAVNDGFSTNRQSRAFSFALGAYGKRSVVFKPSGVAHREVNAARFLNPEIGRMWLLLYNVNRNYFTRQSGKRWATKMLKILPQIVSESGRDHHFSILCARFVRDSIDNGIRPMGCIMPLQRKLSRFLLSEQPGDSQNSASTTSVAEAVQTQSGTQSASFGNLACASKTRIDTLDIIMTVREYLNGMCTANASCSPERLALPDIAIVTEALSVAFILSQGEIADCLDQYIEYMHLSTLQRTISTMMTRFRSQPGHVRPTVFLIGKVCQAQLFARIPWSCLVNASVLSRLYLHNHDFPGQSSDSVQPLPKDTTLGALGIQLLSYMRSQRLVLHQTSDESGEQAVWRDKQDIAESAFLLASRISWLAKKQGSPGETLQSLAEWIALQSELEQRANSDYCMLSMQHEERALHGLPDEREQDFSQEADRFSQNYRDYCLSNFHYRYPNADLWISWEIQYFLLCENASASNANLEWTHSSQLYALYRKMTCATFCPEPRNRQDFLLGMMVGAYRARLHLSDVKGTTAPKLSTANVLKRIAEQILHMEDSQDDLWVFRSFHSFIGILPLLSGSSTSGCPLETTWNRMLGIEFRHFAHEILDSLPESCVPNECIDCAGTARTVSVPSHRTRDDLSLTEHILAKMIPTVGDFGRQWAGTGILARSMARSIVAAQGLFTSEYLEQRFPRCFLLARCLRMQHNCLSLKLWSAEDQNRSRRYDVSRQQQRVFHLLQRQASQQCAHGSN